MKRVVCVCGSPRPKGNCMAIAQRIMDMAAGMGAECETFMLYEMDFRGCVACMACKTGAERCVQQDGATPVLKAVEEADILLFSSPIYWGQVTGEFKCFLDRMYSFLSPGFHSGSPSRLAPGKKCVLIFTQGHADEDEYTEVDRIYAFAFGPERLGYETQVLRARGVRAEGEVLERADVMARAERLARELMG